MRALSIWASALLLANISVFLYGQTPVQPTSTPLRELIQELERQNPSVIAGQKAYEAARFESKQASALPDTNVMVQHLSVGSPRPFACSISSLKESARAVAAGRPMPAVLPRGPAELLR